MFVSKLSRYCLGVWCPKNGWPKCVCRLEKGWPSCALIRSRGDSVNSGWTRLPKGGNNARKGAVHFAPKWVRKKVRFSEPGYGQAAEMQPYHRIYWIRMTYHGQTQTACGKVSAAGNHCRIPMSARHRATGVSYGKGSTSVPAAVRQPIPVEHTKSRDCVGTWWLESIRIQTT